MWTKASFRGINGLAEPVQAWLSTFNADARRFDENTLEAGIGIEPIYMDLQSSA
jgi:hypothetical protein